MTGLYKAESPGEHANFRTQMSNTLMGPISNQSELLRTGPLLAIEFIVFSNFSFEFKRI